MGYYGPDGWWVEAIEGMDPPPGGRWRIDVVDMGSAPPPPAAYSGSPQELYGTGLPGDPLLSPQTQGGGAAPPSPPPPTAPARPPTPTGTLPVGFGSLDEYLQWRRDFAAEHGGMTPEQLGWNVQDLAEQRLTAQAWAAAHGNPASWGYGPFNRRVPEDIWRLINTVRRSPDYGPLGPAAQARAVDMLGGGLLAMQGINYHPSITAQAGKKGLGYLIRMIAPWLLGQGG